MLSAKQLSELEGRLLSYFSKKMAGKALARVGSVSVLPMLGVKVHAVEEQPSGRVKAKELPIYENPQDQIKLDYIPEKPNALQRTISSWRQGLQKFLQKDGVKSKTERVGQIVGTSKAHTENLVGYLQSDLVNVPRLLVIFVAGLGGIAVAYRGRFLRKTIYAAVGVTGAGILCYPQQARELSEQGLDQLREYSDAGWQKVKGHAWEMWKSPRDKSDSSKK